MVTYSALSAKQWLRTWWELVALAADGSVPVDGAVLVGRGRAAVGRLRAPGRDQARAFLSTALELYDEAMSEPLPVLLRTSREYARLRLHGRSRELAQRTAGETLRREYATGYDDLVWGGPPDLATVLAARPTPADARRAPDEGTRFGALSVAWWRDLTAHTEPSGPARPSGPTLPDRPMLSDGPTLPDGDRGPDGR